MKKLVISLVSVTALIAAAALIVPRLQSPEHTVIEEADRVIPTENEVIEKATHVIDAIFMGEYHTEYGRTEYMFKPVKALKGELDQDDAVCIFVIPLPEDDTDNTRKKLTENAEYMLFLEKNFSVYYDHSKFVQISAPVAASGNAGWNTLCAKVEELKDKNTPAAYGVDYSTSKDVEALIEFSSNIFVVTIDSVYAESTIAPTTVYSCKVTETIKGMPAENGNILITMFNGTVNVGEEYVVLLADATNTAPVYTLAAKEGCVYPVGTDVVIVSNLLKEGKTYTTINNSMTDDEILAAEESAR